MTRRNLDAFALPTTEKAWNFSETISGEKYTYRGYDADDTIEFIEVMGAHPVIPPRVNRKKQQGCDWCLYKERHLVECFIGKIKHFRRVFSRFDKLAGRFLSFI